MRYHCITGIHIRHRAHDIIMFYNNVQSYIYIVIYASESIIRRQQLRKQNEIRRGPRTVVVGTYVQYRVCMCVRVQ